MEQMLIAPAPSNDTGGVLPMDTGATVNGTDDLGKTSASASTNAVVKKKGRGRPPKSPGSIKVKTDGPKRSRGRPPKSNNASKKVNKSSSPSRTSDGAKKKRGRPSKSSSSSSNKVQQNSTVNNSAAEPTKKKRGRPSGSSIVKAKDRSTKKKRGRPANAAKTGKAIILKPKITTSNDGTIRKRGRPKKSAPLTSSNNNDGTAATMDS